MEATVNRLSIHPDRPADRCNPGSFCRVYDQHRPTGSGPRLKGDDHLLLRSYRLEIFNNECMPDAMSVQCHAHLDQDVSDALPYLNAVLGGFEYLKDPPSVTFKLQGKLLTVHGNKIAVNALKNEDEAHKIIAWLKREINLVWENRAEIQPSYEGMPRIQVIDILKRLPRTNCTECGAPTCMVFATQVAEGAKDASHCPALNKNDKDELNAFLNRFQLDI
jgi:ArsR family metal-binding transcriptional regulator